MSSKHTRVGQSNGSDGGTTRRSISLLRSASFDRFQSVCVVASLLLAGSLALHHAHVVLLLLSGLEAAVAKLGGGVDELELDLFESGARGLSQEGLPQSDDSLLGAHDVA